jgi:hypothetical protein
VPGEDVVIVRGVKSLDEDVGIARLDERPEVIEFVIDPGVTGGWGVRVRWIRRAVANAAYGEEGTVEIRTVVLTAGRRSEAYRVDVDLTEHC